MSTSHRKAPQTTPEHEELPTHTNSICGFSGFSTVGLITQTAGERCYRHPTRQTPPVPSPAPKQPGRAWTGGTNPSPRGHPGGPTASSRDPSPREGRDAAGDVAFPPCPFSTSQARRAPILPSPHPPAIHSRSGARASAKAQTAQQPSPSQLNSHGRAEL